MATERLAIGQPAVRRGQQAGVARMLIGDAYIAIRLLKEVLRRIAGVPADASFLTTLFALGVLADALRRVAAPALRAFRPKRPSVADAMIAVAVLREPPRAIAGVRASETWFTGTMIALSLVVPALRRIAAPALRAPAAFAAFARRYGF